MAKEQASYPLPKTVKKFKRVKLGQEEIFELRIGKRVLKRYLSKTNGYSFI